MSVLPLVDAIAGDTFRSLVRQFSQELCFYRELIQNALDAGTHRVEVGIVHQDGLATIDVRDDGEGMDRKAIDEQLTRLFSSGKEDDLTKVGKFGIGFVSVFAIAPEEVVVDTGRNGEHWRIVFKASGEFQRIRGDDPTNGTHVRIVKILDAAEFPAFLERSVQAIRYWCQYCPIDIVVNGVSINSPLGLDGPIQVRVEEQGTTVVVALAQGTQFGFYCGGITLLEGTDLADLPALRTEDWLSGIAFKINSRYLGHTLSRDGIKFDANFRKALALLKRTVTSQLMAELYRKLEADPTSTLGQYGAYVRRTLSTAGADRRFFPQVEGPPRSLADLRQAEPRSRTLLRRLGAPKASGVFFCDTQPGPVSKALAALGIPTLRCDAGHDLCRLLETVGLSSASGSLIVPQFVSDINVPSQLKKLLNATLDLLRSCGLVFASAGFGHWTPGDRAALYCRRGETLVRVESAPLAADRLLLHVGHPLVLRLAAVSETDMPGAAYLLARAVCLAGGVPGRLRDRLVNRSLEGLRA